MDHESGPGGDDDSRAAVTGAVAAVSGEFADTPGGEHANSALAGQVAVPDKTAVFKPVLAALGMELIVTLSLLLGVSFVVFLILYLSPGDPFAVLLEGQDTNQDARQALQQAVNLPQSWYGRYFQWLGNLLQGDFGASVRTGQPVLPLLLRATILTLILTLGAMAVVLAVAIPVALYTAVNKASWIRTPLTLSVYLMSAAPVFWLGYLAIYFCVHGIGIFPVLRSDGWELSQLLIPVLVLGLGSGALGEVVQYLREAVERVMTQEYIRTARAKGASVWRHGFKEGFLLPVTEIFSSKVPFMLGGAIIVEQIFNWPGLGRMAWQAAQDRDFPVIMGVTLIAAIMVRLGGVIHKTVFAAVNPAASQGR